MVLMRSLFFSLLDSLSFDTIHDNTSVIVFTSPLHKEFVPIYPRFEIGVSQSIILDYTC
jgi:hypothetical protein